MISIRLLNIYNYFKLHILTIVFPDMRNVKYLPIFNGSYSMAYIVVVFLIIYLIEPNTFTLIGLREINP